MENTFNLKKFLAEGKLLKEEEIGGSINSLEDAFFMDNDEFIEIDKDIFKNYILTNKAELKSLWDSVGGNWEQDNITDDEISKAVERFSKNYEQHTKSSINADWVGKMYKNFEDTGSLNFDEDIKTGLLNAFSDDLDMIINLNKS
jgi:hypothetical protein